MLGVMRYTFVVTLFTFIVVVIERITNYWRDNV
jgi:hypothetical protein